MNSAEKSKFRNRKPWKLFRARLKKERKVDELTHSRLSKTFNLHHLILTDKEEIYTDLTHPENYMCLNPQSHDMLHLCYDNARRDPEFMDRLNKAVERMLELNDSTNVKNPFV